MEGGRSQARVGPAVDVELVLGHPARGGVVTCPLTDLLLPGPGPAAPVAPPAPSRRFLRRLHLIEQLPQRQQSALAATIDAFLKAQGKAG
jgi:hypothetical protein